MAKIKKEVEVLICDICKEEKSSHSRFGNKWGQEIGMDLCYICVRVWDKWIEKRISVWKEKYKDNLEKEFKEHIKKSNKSKQQNYGEYNDSSTILSGTKVNQRLFDGEAADNG